MEANKTGTVRIVHFDEHGYTLRIFTKQNSTDFDLVKIAGMVSKNKKIANQDNVTKRVYHKKGNSTDRVENLNDAKVFVSGSASKDGSIKITSVEPLHLEFKSAYQLNSFFILMQKTCDALGLLKS